MNWAFGLLIFGMLQAPPQKPLRERLLERAQRGDAEAQYELGKNYETGRIGLPKDYEQARHWYLEAADHGDPFGSASLAILYHFGKGVPKDAFQAYVWYERAALRLKGGDRDSVVEMRDRAARELSKERLAEADRQARDWKPAEGK